MDKNSSTMYSKHVAWLIAEKYSNFFNIKKKKRHSYVSA